jgi:hypothetical protein
MLQKNEQEGKTPEVAVPITDKPKKTNPHAFFNGVQVGSAEAVQSVVTWGPAQMPNDHAWSKPGADVAAFMVTKSDGRTPAYFSMGAYDPAKVERWKGRTAANVLHLRGFWIDVDGGPEKWAKAIKGNGTGAVYETAEAIKKAVRDWVQVTGLVPTYLVQSGSGGMHLHYVLDAYISRDVWQGRANALVALATAKGFKIDAPCTTDAARIFRAPGSIHQSTGALVQAHGWRVAPYTLEEFGGLVGYDSDADETFEALSASGRGFDLSVNGDITGEFPKYSIPQAARQCAAIAKAIENNGHDTSEPVWFLAAVAADKSVDGREYAHTISSGHKTYNKRETDRKLDRTTGGPAGCDAWAKAYGPGGPCDSCEFRKAGTVKNPAIQLGGIVDTTPPGIADGDESAPTDGWVAEMNQRFALVRHGSRLIVADFQTPSMSGRGVIRGLGYLDVSGFRAMFNGRFAPRKNATEKARPLVDAWLSHPKRRQYEGLVYAPGEDIPSNILNLWQGFAVEPIAGDVSLWLEVLAALVPNESERLYVLRWIAWKIQNPGGVPDTILIFKGAKGTGKNSLFDPIVLLFGRHAMLADDPELIAGRFTWHLMHLSFAVLDEAVFIGDPKQADRIKSRVTAKTMQYEQKGMDPVQGVNRCAYVMLTNHEYVWAATRDERRAVIQEVGEALRGNVEFWTRYHAWAAGDGPAALLHYLQGIDLTGFNPRVIPKGEALRKQVEQTTLRNPAAAWWHGCLSDGAIRWRDVGDRVAYLKEDTETEIDRSALRLSYEQTTAQRSRGAADWSATARKVREWAGPDGIRTVQARRGSVRERVDLLPPLHVLRESFTAATQVHFSE